MRKTGGLMNVECRLRLRRVWKGYVKRKVSELNVLSFCIIVIIIIIVISYFACALIFF